MARQLSLLNLTPWRWTLNGQPLPNADAMVNQMKSRTVTTTITPTGKPSSIQVGGPDGGLPGMDFSKMANFQGAANCRKDQSRLAIRGREQLM